MVNYYKLQNLDEVVDGLEAYVKELKPIKPYTGIWFDFITKLEAENKRIYVKVLSGKYKGSIGYFTGSDSIQLGENFSDRMTAIGKKGLKLLPNYNGPLLMEVKEREITDIFGVTIKVKDKIIFAERGKLHFGVLIEFDFHKNKFIVQTIKGKKTLNPRKSDFVNVTTINETFIENEVLLAKLKG